MPCQDGQTPKPRLKGSVIFDVGHMICFDSPFGPNTLQRHVCPTFGRKV